MLRNVFKYSTCINTVNVFKYNAFKFCPALFLILDFVFIISYVSTRIKYKIPIYDKTFDNLILFQQIFFLSKDSFLLIYKYAPT